LVENCERADHPFTGRTHENVEHDRKDRQIVTLEVVGRSGLPSGPSRQYLKEDLNIRRDSAKCVVSIRHNSHTDFHRQADENRCRTVLNDTRSRQQVDCFQSRSHWQLLVATAAPRKRGSCVWEKTTVKQPLVRPLVSNKTLCQSGRGTATVQTARARYTLTLKALN
jgi:hypothetical protein